MDRKALRTRAAAAALAAAALCGCGGPPEPEGPAGAWWAGRGESVRALLDQLAALEGTPLGRRAVELTAALPDCELVGAHAPDGDAAALLDTPLCLDAGHPLAAALARADAELAFALPRESGVPLRGAVRRGADALELAVDGPLPDAPGALALLVPGSAPAGADRLSSRARLAQLRVRARDGIDLAALVPAESQADRLFRLRSELFAGAALDGSWEAAVYLPERPGEMPGLALALGTRLRSAAIAGAERFVAELARTWSVRPSPIEIGPATGACLRELNVMPELAPCYVATPDALVVGWNPASLARALDPERRDAPAAAARADLDLALLGEADVRLARHAGLADAIPGARWPWRRVEASAETAGDVLSLRVRLLLERQARR